MSVNNLTINEQAYALIAELHLQATGQKASAVVDLSSFISTAQKTLRAGYEPVLNGISIMVSRTIMAIRPYYRKFAGMEYTAEKWGGIIRKISFADTDPTETKAFDLTDGQSIDPWKINKPKVLETRYVGSDVWDMDYTITREQLKARFAGPAELVSFFNAVMLHFSNLREQHLEEMARATVCNMIAAKNVINSGVDVIHLLTEYNTIYGTSLTSANCLYHKDFLRYCAFRIKQVATRMSVFSTLFNIGGTEKFTPREDLRIILHETIDAGVSAFLQSDTFHDELVKLPQADVVPFWQGSGTSFALADTTAINVSVLDDSGTKQDVSEDYIIACMFDRNALGVTAMKKRVTSKSNAKAEFYNYWYKEDAGYFNDYNENFVVFLAD